MHVQHLLNANIEFFNLHKELNIPLIITLHDYYCICPFIKLIDIHDSYCGEKGITACNFCLKERIFYSYTLNENIKSIIEWRNFWHNYLKEAYSVIVPSFDMKNRINKYFPNLKISVFENPEIINFTKIKKLVLLEV